MFLFKFQHIPQVVTFESLNSNGYYIAHQNSLGYIRKLDQSALVIEFLFKLVNGLDGQGISFESVNFPGRFIRHRTNNELWIDFKEDTELYRRDSTFKHKRYL